jgi:hypothetical protein
MSVTPDGQRFLFLSVGQDQQTGSADRQLVVIQYWFDELERLVPTP